MKSKMRGALLVAGLALFLILGSLGSLALAPEAQVNNPDPLTIVVNTTSIATDTTFSGYVWGRYSSADLFYRIDQTDAATNSTSLEIEVSPDGSNWYDHSISGTLLADNAADANGYIPSIPIHGWQWRIIANATNTNTLTPELHVVLR